jgi:hypothetical protein
VYPLTLDGEVVRGYATRPGTPDRVACGDPRALTHEGQCLPTVTLVQFDKKGLDDLDDWLRAQGLPVFVIPLPAPAPGPIGPDPAPPEP